MTHYLQTAPAQQLAAVAVVAFVALALALAYGLPRRLVRLPLVALVTVINGARYLLTFHRAGMARLEVAKAAEERRRRAARRQPARHGRRMTREEIEAARLVASIQRHPAGRGR